MKSPNFSAASKAAGENKPVIAALERCATQNQVQHRLFPQPVEAVAFPKASNTMEVLFHLRNSLPREQLAVRPQI
jgi:hypothetical protein